VAKLVLDEIFEHHPIELAERHLSECRDDPVVKDLIPIALLTALAVASKKALAIGLDIIADLCFAGAWRKRRSLKLRKFGLFGIRSAGKRFSKPKRAVVDFADDVVQPLFGTDTILRSIP
jgi:hypothetical protein